MINLISFGQKSFIKRYIFYFFILNFFLIRLCLADSYYGFLEGRHIYLASELNGKISEIFVKRGDTIQQDQLLFKIDDEGERINIKILTEKQREAQSNLDFAKENLNFEKNNLNRKLMLNNEKLISESTLNVAQNNFFNAQNKVQIAQEDLNEAHGNYHLELLKQRKKIITAPCDGFIVDEFYSKGEFAEIGSPILSLLPKNKINAVFYVPNKEIQIVKKGMLINISCENCQSNLTGKINYIQSSPEFTPPNIYSSNFQEELVFRVEAEVLQKATSLINIGQPIKVNF